MRLETDVTLYICGLLVYRFESRFGVQSDEFCTRKNKHAFTTDHWRIQEFEKGEHIYMASAEREPIMGSGGFAPSGIQGQNPSWFGGQGALLP